MKRNSPKEAVKVFGPDLAPVLRKLAEKMDMEKAPVKKPVGKEKFHRYLMSGENGK